MFKIFSCVFLLPTSFPPCLQVTTPEVMMPSSMFLPAAAPEKDGNSAAEELGKQPGEWGQQGPGSLRPQLPTRDCLGTSLPRPAPCAHLSPRAAVGGWPAGAVPWAAAGPSRQLRLRSTAHHHGDSPASAAESLPREEQRWPRAEGPGERRGCHPQMLLPALLCSLGSLGSLELLSSLPSPNLICLFTAVLGYKGMAVNQWLFSPGFVV